MYTKHLEHIGESLVIYSLLEAGILVAKPFFDKAGADLVGITSVDNRAKICRIQCKYRELKTRTSVVVDSEYVKGAFVLFLYLKFDGEKHLLCFLPKDIRKFYRKGHLKNKDVYRLSINSKTFSQLTSNNSLMFTEAKVNNLNKLISESSSDMEMRRLAKDMIRKSRELINTHQKADRLKDIIHQIKILDIEKKANEEKMEILQDYVQFMEKYKDQIKDNP